VVLALPPKPVVRCFAIGGVPDRPAQEAVHLPQTSKVPVNMK